MVYKSGILYPYTMNIIWKHYWLSGIHAGFGTYSMTCESNIRFELGTMFRVIQHTSMDLLYYCAHRLIRFMIVLVGYIFFTGKRNMIFGKSIV